MKKISCPLRREDWDFNKCRTGSEDYCSLYEHLRELPHLCKTPDGDDELPFWFPKTGFPELPFLLSKCEIPGPSFVGFQETATRNGVGNASTAAFKKARTKAQKLYFRFLYVDWRKPDKSLVAGFSQWLKENRPVHATEMRGKGSSRRHMAELKALGALRLLRHFTAVDAMEYTKRTMGHPLYSKPSDWYEARSKANMLLNGFQNRGPRFWQEDSIRIP